MKTTIHLILLFVMASAVAYAQDKKEPKKGDKEHKEMKKEEKKEPKENKLSPLKTSEGTINGAKVKVVYHAPSARGRKMIGEKEPYGQVWRTGADNATTFEVNKAVKIEGQDLPAGKYELFTIPGETEWTIIFQKFGNQWGAYSYKQENDVLRVTVPAGKPDAFVETLDINVGKEKVNIKWENSAVAFAVK
jgi:hypothetical protein